MILVDANLLLYAEDRRSPHHGKSMEWWDGRLSGTEPVCLCWPVLGAFLRLATNSRVFERPLTPESWIFFEGRPVGWREVSAGPD